MYAIVSAGGRQEKVAVGDVIEVDKLDGEAGDTVDAARRCCVVDGETVTSDAASLAKVDGHRRGRRAHQGPEDHASSSTRTRPATTSARVTVSS